MLSKIYWINDNLIGEQLLGIMPRPRGNDWLEDEIKGIKKREVDILISLLEFEEVHELGLAKEDVYCKENDIEFLRFPIKDVNTPKNENKFLELIRKIATEINNSKKIVIHCRMGIGRSSMMAAGVMIKLGYHSENIFDEISKFRGLTVPDTKEQIKWILSRKNII